MFFGFQSCKYLKVSQAEQWQTEQLYMRNILFFKDGEILPLTHLDLKFADCVFVTFNCQKREDKHNTVTQESSRDSVLCPVRFVAGLVRRIWSYKRTDSSTWISTYISNTIIEHVQSMQVINALHNVVGAIGKTRLGITKNKIGTHSIRSGGAMAMYRGECSLYTIMLISWWSSNAFLWYICKQVMEFSHKVFRKMIQFKTDHHIPTFKHSKAPNNPRVHNNPNNAKTRQNISGDASWRTRLPAFSQFN